VTYVAMAQAKNGKGDKQGATKELEKALELDPQNAQAKTLLAQLKTQ
jgi:Tfp pilus assembly protein PilF